MIESLLFVQAEVPRWWHFALGLFSVSCCLFPTSKEPQALWLASLGAALDVQAASLAQLPGGRFRGVWWMAGMDWLLCNSFPGSRQQDK